MPLFTISRDDLEGGGVFSGTGYWLGPWRLEGAAHIIAGFLHRGPPTSGSFHLILQGPAGEATRSVDLSRESSVRLQFWAKADSLELRDSAEVLACGRDCGDEGSWTVLKRWGDREDDNTYRLYDLALPGSMLTREFQLRFRAGMSEESDWLFVDDLELVSPLPGPTPTPTVTPTPTPIPSPTPTPRRRSPTSVPPQDVSVTIPGFSFNLSRGAVDAGRQVRFNVTNNHGIFHTFTIVPSASDRSQTLVNLQLNPGDAATGTRTFPKGTGSVYYYCTVPGHEDAGMKGTLNVSG
jgi:plastocyanin